MRQNIKQYLVRRVHYFIEIYFKCYAMIPRISRKPCVLILTPGKVGSSSVYKTLKAQNFADVFHIHRISQKGVEGSVARHLQSHRKSLPYHLYVSQYLRVKFKELLNGKLYCITIIREPISRELSSVFQNLDMHFVDANKGAYTVENCLKVVQKNLHERPDGGLEEWLNTELDSTFGIDVMKRTLPSNRPFEITKVKGVRHLLIRLEDLDQFYSQAIRELIPDLTQHQLLQENVGNRKEYSEVYSLVKTNLVLPAQTLTAVIESKYFRAFYSERKDSVLDAYSGKR